MDVVWVCCLCVVCADWWLPVTGVDRPGSGGSAWPTPVTSAPSGLVTLLGGSSGGVTTTAAGNHVLLADTPPTLELMTDKADNSQLAGRLVQPPVKIIGSFKPR